MIFFLVLAAAIFIIGLLALLIAAFRVSFWWGLFMLFCPPVQLLFVLVHWSKAWRPLLLQLLGIVLVVIGIVLGVTGEKYKTQFDQYLQKVAPEQMQKLNEWQASRVSPTVANDTAPVESNQAGDEKSAPAFAEPVGNQKVIHKCVDAQGRVAYTEKPCDGAQEKQVITIKNGDDNTPAQSD